MSTIGKIVLAVTLGLGLVAASAGPGAAQGTTLGTFRWELIRQGGDTTGETVTLTIEVHGAAFTLSGYDEVRNQQGQVTGVFATYGTAFLRTDGKGVLGFTTVFDTHTLHTHVELDPVTLVGTWKDDGQNTGSFQPR